jgi:hypothetical protein
MEVPMKTKNGKAGNGLGHMHTDWSGGVARFTATPNKRERQARKDRREKQKGWES